MSLMKKATSLKIITKKNQDNSRLISLLLKEFEILYKKCQKSGFKPILKEWKQLCGIFGKKTKIITSKKTYNCTPIDVDDKCNLIIKLNNGKITSINEGDVTLR